MVVNMKKTLREWARSRFAKGEAHVRVGKDWMTEAEFLASSTTRKSLENDSRKKAMAREKTR